MPIYFLFSYKVLNESLNHNIKTNSAIVSKNMLDLVGRILEDNECDLYATSQALDKLKDSINSEQHIRLCSCIKKETTTRGVSGFDPNTSTSESAKNLSLNGITIVVAGEEEKPNIIKNKRMIVITPAEFINSYNAVSTFYDKLPFKEKFLDVLLFYLFKPEIIKDFSSKIE